MTQTRQKQSRIIGYDFARAIAILGMIIVNFKLVMAPNDEEPAWLKWLTGLLEGRAAATFVVLAGVGISLLSRQACESNNPLTIALKRQVLFRRAIFLFGIGLCFAPIWSPDILHYYGVYIALGAMLLTVSNHTLLRTAFMLVILFVILIGILNYEAGWDWDTLEYVDFWTPIGFPMHLFFNGFHPVIPWGAFLLVGMWLGRQEMQSSHIRRRILYSGVLAVAVAESLSAALIRGLDLKPLSDDALAFGTGMIPPMPLYMLAGIGVAFLTISLSISFTERFASHSWLQPFISVGQLALTAYIAHVIVGIGFVDSLSTLGEQSLVFSVCYSMIFFTGMTAFAHLWRQHFQRGPFEWVMRKMTDLNPPSRNAPLISQPASDH